MLVLASISESLFNIASHFVRDTGLPAVFVLMVAESACIPIPSEATMLFAGFAVTDPAVAHHHLTLAGVVVAGVLGNLIGSWIAYGWRTRCAPAKPATAWSTGSRAATAGPTSATRP